MSTDVLEYVSRNILKATTDYGHRVEYCSQLASSSQPPTLDKDALVALKTTRDDTVLAIGFLQSRNSFGCEQETRLKLAFHLGTMASLKKEWHPSKKELELEVKYLTLSEEVRDYFEAAIGNTPFDLVNTLETNGLMR